MQRSRDYTATLGRPTLQPPGHEIERVRAKVEREDVQDDDEVIVAFRWTGVNLRDGIGETDQYEATWGKPSSEGGYTITRDNQLYHEPIKRQ